ncbi:fimbrial protein [Gallibacterium anatis]|uniref:fimbrial protein n=1 Tax=Gallibacterium anatis TaxID=750 RepID=UPI00211B0D0F|nr:fimbrial protein [Gallibacterium anatis]WAX71506.1 fimbrial protein [Gallibacterium anatis]
MPVLLKGEKMKGKIIHWFISMMALVILFKPSFSFAYIFEGKDVGGSTVPPKQERYFNVNYHRVGYNEVVYRWNIGEIMAGNYCRQRAGVMNPVDKYWLEIKYFDTQEKNSQYFERRLLEVNNRLVTINDASSYQFAIVERGQSLTFDLRLKLKDTFLYNTTPSDISIPANTPLAIITMLCVDKTTPGNTVTDYQDKDNREYKYNSFSMIKITSADSATFSFARTCRLTNNNQTIKLKDVTVKELNEKGEVFGKDFKISLNCVGASAKNAYIIFTDGNRAQNDGSGMGLLISDSTMAMNTGLVVKDESGNPLVYRQPLPKNGGFFGVPEAKAGFYEFSPLSSGQVVDRTYKVYYHKMSKNRSVQPGEISAKLIYNIYYN